MKGGGGGGEFSACTNFFFAHCLCRIFFFRWAPLHEIFLLRVKKSQLDLPSAWIFFYLLLCMNFFFLGIFPCMIFFCFFPHPPPHHFSNGPSLMIASLTHPVRSNVPVQLRRSFSHDFDIQSWTILVLYIVYMLRSIVHANQLLTKPPPGEGPQQALGIFWDFNETWQRESEKFGRDGGIEQPFWGPSQMTWGYSYFWSYYGPPSDIFMKKWLQRTLGISSINRFRLASIQERLAG